MTINSPFSSIARAALPTLSPTLAALIGNRQTEFPPEDTPFPTSPAMQQGAGVSQTVPQSGVPATLYNVFTSAGFTPNAIYGILGNVQQESQFNPMAHNAKEGAGGLFQWRHERLTGGQAYVANMGLDWRDPTGRAQALWAVEEINRNPTLKAKLNAARTPEEAATIFDREFEKSAGLHTAARQQFARKWAGGTPSPYTIPQEMAQHPEGLLPTSDPNAIDPTVMEKINMKIAQLRGEAPSGNTPQRSRTFGDNTQEGMAEGQGRRANAQGSAPGDTFDPSLGQPLVDSARGKIRDRRMGQRSLPRVQIPGRG